MTTPDIAHLTTGWEPALDPGDTVLRQFTLNFAESFASAAKSMGGRVLRGSGFVLTDHGRPAGFYNTAVLTAPPAAWDLLLREIEHFYAATGSGDVHLFSPWPTPDLTPRGWQLEGHPPFLVRAPGGTVPPPAPEGRIVELTDGDSLEEWARVAVEGYPLIELLPYRTGSFIDGRLLSDRRWRCWIGYDGGRAVALGATFTAYGFHQLALGVTLPEARGRGFWYGLVRERLMAEPALISGAIFSDDSRPGMEKLGYIPVVRFACWRLSRGEFL